MSEANASYLEWNGKCFIAKWNEAASSEKASSLWSTPDGVWSILRRCRKIWSTAYAVWSEAFSGFIHHFCRRQKWWAMTDSNRRHFACKANALTNWANRPLLRVLINITPVRVNCKYFSLLSHEKNHQSNQIQCNNPPRLLKIPALSRKK